MTQPSPPPLRRAHAEDPNDGRRERYWDGNVWTSERRDKVGKPHNGWFVLAVLIPISGLVLAIIESTQGNTGAGSHLPVPDSWCS